MTNRATRRRYKKRSGRDVWVFSELNADLRPSEFSAIITRAGLDRARRETEARAQVEEYTALRREDGENDHA